LHEVVDAVVFAAAADDESSYGKRIQRMAGGDGHSKSMLTSQDEEEEEEEEEEATEFSEEDAEGDEDEDEDEDEEVEAWAAGAEMVLSARTDDSVDEAVE